MGQFYLHHVLHALAIAKVINFEPSTRILDVGTGGGFPSIPLAILFPDSYFLAVDSIHKKIKVVNSIIDQLGIENIEGRHQRAEELKGESFDFIVSRAVARADSLIKWVDDKIKSESFNALKNGYLFLKGGDLEEELSATGKKYTIYPINRFFEHAFFETKKVVYLPTKPNTNTN